MFVVLVVVQPHAQLPERFARRNSQLVQELTYQIFVLILNVLQQRLMRGEMLLESFCLLIPFKHLLRRDTIVSAAFSLLDLILQLKRDYFKNRPPMIFITHLIGFPRFELSKTQSVEPLLPFLQFPHRIENVLQCVRDLLRTIV